MKKNYVFTQWHVHFAGKNDSTDNSLFLENCSFYDKWHIDSVLIVCEFHHCQRRSQMWLQICTAMQFAIFDKHSFECAPFKTDSMLSSHSNQTDAQTSMYTKPYTLTAAHANVSRLKQKLHWKLKIVHLQKKNKLNHIRFVLYSKTNMIFMCINFNIDCTIINIIYMSCCL